VAYTIYTKVIGTGIWVITVYWIIGTLAVDAAIRRASISIITVYWIIGTLAVDAAIRRASISIITVNQRLNTD